MKRILGTLFFFLLASPCISQNNISGKIYNSSGAKMPHVHISIDSLNLTTFSDTDGNFILKVVPAGKYKMVFSHVGFKKKELMVTYNGNDQQLEVAMDAEIVQLSEVVVVGRGNNSPFKQVAVDGMFIYASKKNEQIDTDNLVANKSLNIARQIFSKVAGVNIWENDGSGLQLNISTRGLSPNRSWEFNVRQDGMNIQADVLGYPDTYYTPTTEAIETIEIVRGSASLQYGTQLGGLVNFKMKRSRGEKPLEVSTRQTVGSYNLFNSYNSVGGTKKKWSYYTYYHHRNADGWRENSEYNTNTGYAAITYKPNDKLTIEATYTRMKYLLQLSAGLTDSMYLLNHRMSNRSRNWFQVDWNFPTLTLDYQPSKNLTINIKAFGLYANRNSIENTKSVNIKDDMSFRDMRMDNYLNWGTEMRIKKSYKLGSKISSSLIGGMRLYRGRTSRKQGLGTASSEPDFNFIHPYALEYNDYNFYTDNIAFFAESVFFLTKRLSVTSGFRWEYIDLNGYGYYNNKGELRYERPKRKRTFPLAGIGLEYSLSKRISWYTNWGQGFRGVNFNDIRIDNPNILIDPQIKDSNGYNFEAGARGKIANAITFDCNIFLLNYSNRIGIETVTDEEGNSVQRRSNISDSRNYGLEVAFEVSLLKIFRPTSKNILSTFVSYAWIRSKYLDSRATGIINKTVEFVPRHNLKTGLEGKLANFRSSLNFTFLSEQFSNANNTIFTPSGNEGLVKAYFVTDLSTSYTFEPFVVEFGINNLGNKKYFTRRASSYPGPGLIPAEPRTFYITVGFEL